MPEQESYFSKLKAATETAANTAEQNSHLPLKEMLAKMLQKSGCPLA